LAIREEISFAICRGREVCDKANPQREYSKKTVRENNLIRVSTARRGGKKKHRVPLHTHIFGRGLKEPPGQTEKKKRGKNKFCRTKGRVSSINSKKRKKKLGGR